MVEYTFKSATHGTFTKVDQILGHKVSLKKYKNIKIISFILKDNNGIKLEINTKRNYRKYTNTWKLNNTPLNDQWFIKEIREEI
jgi:hypothetical protein